MNEITRILERVDPSWVVGNAALRDTTTTNLWRGLRGRVRRSATNATIPNQSVNLDVSPSPKYT